MPDTAGVKTLLTVQETAAQLRMSKWFVLNMVHEGKLRAVRFGRLMKFRQAEIDRFVDSSTPNSDS